MAWGGDAVLCRACATSYELLIPANSLAFLGISPGSNSRCNCRNRIKAFFEPKKDFQVSSL